ncbi:L-histidine N(alpha)-methyltransferase [Verrucosispora sp. WMMD573]|uniref:L-histidine N(alpha)-methyltransferase n=1 Tax=Verrucosispora sp. WMMD573 TaxID=3015149 RepID=UPI00248C4D72|nr:L-histidine N(alpha)-methyltransferase [Verrucosispora sp. WMMD573]WBB53991.1 L-histidine N(alpha)-methyltransferase [Verrucosispora sp. WMMD573]
MPLKFAYAGSAAHTHDTYASSADYLSMLTAAHHEADALISAGMLAVGALTVAEIGPGNGGRSRAFLERLGSRGRPCRRYLALDFSETLLGIACARLTRFAGDRMSVDSHVWDIECGTSCAVERWRAGTAPVVGCLLGHTLGNVEQPVRVLANIRDALCVGDVLLLSVALAPRHTATADAVLAPYRSPEFREAALQPLLAAGLAGADLDFALTWHDDVVVGEAVLRRPARLDDGELAAGHRIRCFQSRRFRPRDVIVAVEEAGWQVRAVAYAPGDAHLVVTAARR